MNLSRRVLLGSLPAFAVATAAGTALAGPKKAKESVCAAFTPDMQKAVTPDHAIEMLKEGHKRFISGRSVRCNLLAQVHATEAGQAPFACVIGCMDSRVPPELVFDQQIGDIFTARVAGNFVNTDILGSMEYATKVAGAKAILVLGHSSCGAVKGAIDDVKLGNLTATLANLMPAVKAAPEMGEHSSKNHELVQKVAEVNVVQNMEKLTRDSEVLRTLVQEGKLKIVGAIHDVHTGKVTFLA